MKTPEASDFARCDAMQEEEWEVLEAIYPDYISRDLHGVVKLEVPVELPVPSFVTAVQTDHAQSEELSTSSELQASERVLPLVSLSNLPPLLLEILLPPSYPLYDPPQIVSLHAMQSWLPLSRLHRIFVDMWDAGDGVLDAWIECVRSGEFLEKLGFTFSAQGDQYIKIPHPAPLILIPQLAAYNTTQEQARFALTSYNCEVCLTSIKGSRCILLSCSHVFCQPCLQDFWKLCITEGDIGRVGCPDPQCVKQGREANEDELRRVVTEEEVRRWKWLKQKRSIEKDPTMIHCPMPFCQTPVAKPTNVDEGSGWERLRTCPECDYSFCAYCRRTWHGPLSDCPLSATETCVLEYLSLEEDAPERKLIEQRYGVANIRRLVAKYQEDEANRKWLAESTVACPSCNVKVEKSVGCNHMTCAKCGQHFCYRCGSKLNAANPYKHFNTPGMRCFSKLFDPPSIDDEWQPIEGFEYL